MDQDTTPGHSGDASMCHPGVYCLRTNELSWDEATLWRTYTQLTDLESVFRRLKSELGFRPVYHSKESRSDGHLFITVLACQYVQVIRTQLRQAGIHLSWQRLRTLLNQQQRFTTSLQMKDGRSVHVRKSTVASVDLQTLYTALKITSAPGGTNKTVI